MDNKFFGKILNIQYDISKSDFEKMINNAPIDNEQKKNLKSIFDRIAGEDKSLNQEEWTKFIKQVDKNKDNNITKTELINSNIFTQSKNAIINFWVSINSIIKNQDYDEIEANGYASFEPENTARASSTTNGTFTGDWLIHDKYYSDNYEDWLNNNNYTLNEELADIMIKNINNKLGKKIYYEKCSKAVTDTNFNINVPHDNLNKEDSAPLFMGERQLRAYQNASEYANNFNFKELPYNIVSTMDLKKLPKGCIIVYDAGYAQNGTHASGHIGITDGHGNDLSWGRFKIADAKQESHIRVFVPVLVT